MARYFFHVSLQDRVILDREGWELPSMDAAKARALEVARRLLASGAVRGSEQAAFHIVGTLRGVPFTVPFEEAAGDAAAHAGECTQTGRDPTNDAVLIVDGRDDPPVRGAARPDHVI